MKTYVGVFVRARDTLHLTYNTDGTWTSKAIAQKMWDLLQDSAGVPDPRGHSLLAVIDKERIVLVWARRDVANKIPVSRI